MKIDCASKLFLESWLGFLLGMCKKLELSVKVISNTRRGNMLVGNVQLPMLEEIVNFVLKHSLIKISKLSPVALIRNLNS